MDSDVIIYAGSADHPFGERVRTLLLAPEPALGSVLLLPEVLAKPMRDGSTGELLALTTLLDRVDLRPTDAAVAKLATALAASYRLRAADAIHLATAVSAGADRFITNNRRDFTRDIVEIDVTYPDDL